MTTTTTSTAFTVSEREQRRSPEELASILENPGFGSVFTEHMAMIEWDKGQGWHDARVVPYGPIPLDPSAAVFHYAQEIFEGLKAYRHEDGTVWTFRPERNAERLNASSSRTTSLIASRNIVGGSSGSASRRAELLRRSALRSGRKVHTVPSACR